MSATHSTVPRPSADELRRLYVDLGLGCPEIGRRFERDPKTVFWWLRQAGIETRKRGANEKVWFKAGEPSAFKGRRHRPESIEMVRAATIRDGRVPYNRNGKHWLKGAAPELNPRWLGGATPERQAFYRSVEWKAACRAVWRRANACCERCRRDFRTVDRKLEGAFHVHHVVSFQVEALRAVVSNLVLLCGTCHRWVHSKANTERAFLAEGARPSLFDLPELAGDAAAAGER